MEDTQATEAGSYGPEGEAMSINRAYGCLFCLTGREEDVARRIRDMDPQVRAMAAMKEKHRVSHGRRTKEKDILLPGYVFFDAPEDLVPLFRRRVDAVIRLLCVDQNDWQLKGNDLVFAKWLMDRDGMLEMSHAYREGDSIRITSGPLKDLEGQILRMDRRGMRGQVAIDFGGKTTLVWLSFDLIEQT